MNAAPSSIASGPALNAYIRERLRRVESSVERLLRPGYARPESLHALHRDLRRLRVIVDWRRSVKSPGTPATEDELALRLRRLTRLVGRVRDLDVELALWKSLRPRVRGPTGGSARALATFGHRLQDDSRTGRELLRATLLAEVHAGFFERVRLSLQAIGSPTTARALSSGILKERDRLARRAARARREALRDPTAERLHEFRVLIRRLRYLTDLEDHLNRQRGSTFPTRYAGALRRLGELHDRDVLAAHLDAVDPALRAEAWSERFREDRRRLRKGFLREMKELHPRRHLGRRRPATG